MSSFLAPLAELRRQFLDQSVTRLGGQSQGSRADAKGFPAAAAWQDSPLVHLVEADAAEAISLQSALRGAGYRVRWFPSPVECAAACAGLGGAPGERPDAVVVDTRLPDAVACTESICGVDADRSRCPPVVFLTERDDMATRLAALRAGAWRSLVKPVEVGRLVAVLDALVDRMPTTPYRVLVVAGDPASAEARARSMGAAGMRVETLARPLEMFEAIAAFEPEVVVLDADLTDPRGAELAAVLRDRDGDACVPVILLSASGECAVSGGGGQAEQCLSRPGRPEELPATARALARESRQRMTIRKRLEAANYERERIHLALDQHAIVSIADAAGNIVFVNDKFCEISGYAPDELVGRNHRVVKSSVHPPEFHAALWQTISSGHTWKGEICNRRKDGSLYWVESSITPFLDEAGVPYRYVSIRTDITHVKAAEAAVRASEARLSFILAESPIVLFTCRPEAGLPAIYVSPNMQARFGFAPGRSLEDPQFRIEGVHPDDAARVMASLAELPARERLAHRFRFRMPGGEFRWIHEAMRVARTDDGTPLEIIGYWADIDDRVRAEIGAEVHKERLRRGQEYANIGTWDWNVQTGELYWTERIGPLFGYPVGELETSYENFLAAIHPDDRQAVVDAVAASVDRSVPYDIEHRVVWPDGSVRWLHERGAVARDADGKPLQMLGVVQDIDDRKRAELALAERERQLREAQALAQVGNWTADFEAGTLTWSDEIYRIFGHEPGSFVPSVEAFHAAVHPDDRALVRESEARAERSGMHDVIHRIVRPDGMVRHVHELARMEVDAAGRRVRMSGTVQDVTERIEVEQALIALREAAERANQAKSDFLSSMSHELRTPMNAILGFGQLMEYDDSLPDAHQDSVREILRAGRHLLELINEVLDLAKIEAGRVDLALEPAELCPIVAECLSLIAPLAEARAIKVSHRGLEGAFVRADRTRLKQVLLNLLSNATKYNREDGKVEVEIEEGDEGRLRLRVADTGPGIPRDRLAELFEPFNRLDAERGDVEGTGIGLTITRRLVEMMGGVVGVESRVGSGSTFWIELPRAAAAEAERGAPQRGVGDAGAGGAVPQRTVLYIEDHPANIKLVAQILGREPHIRLLTAHTPELGIELARLNRPALILLDINLPGMDGYEVLDVLKRDAALAPIPVVAITANAMARDVERGRAAGFVDYLTKPLNIAQFRQVVASCLAAGDRAAGGRTGGGA